MKSQIKPQQIDWLAQIEELSNTEAEQVNGGYDSGISRATSMQNASMQAANSMAEQQMQFQSEMSRLNAENEANAAAVRTQKALASKASA